MKRIHDLLVKLRFVRAVRTTYRGVKFRSTLEADWACTFDQLGISWSYEPIAIRLPDGSGYRPDFYLPAQNVWAEVKGPHDVRIDKPYGLSRTLVDDPFDQRQAIVAILRIPIEGRCVIEGAWPSENVGLTECAVCENWTFVDFDGTWSCRVCGQRQDLFGCDNRFGPPFRQVDPYPKSVR